LSVLQRAAQRASELALAKLCFDFEHCAADANPRLESLIPALTPGAGRKEVPLTRKNPGLVGKNILYETVDSQEYLLISKHLNYDTSKSNWSGWSCETFQGTLPRLVGILPRKE